MAWMSGNSRPSASFQAVLESSVTESVLLKTGARETLFRKS